MKSISEIKQEFMQGEKEWWDELRKHLQIRNTKPLTLLLNSVAWVCNIEAEQMLSPSKNAIAVQPRWLYWYAHRYMTHETYEKIARSFCAEHIFTSRAVGQGINSMSEMIERDPIWNRRWNVIRCVINMINGETTDIDKGQKHRISVVVPVEIADKIEIEVHKKTKTFN